jgi:outer membrane cobalamin receptor
MENNVMKIILRFLMPALCTLFLVASPAFSGTENNETYTLGEIVVTEEREKSVESIGTVREIDSDEIQMKNAHNLNEALELLPGVYIRTAADGVPRVDIRGFRSRHVLLLLDGIPFNSTFDGQFDPAIVPVENIAKIKISYGSNSVLYGQGGLGGVINIITKKGKEGINGEVGGEAGENDTYLSKASVSGKAGKFDFFISSSQNNSDGFKLSDDFAPTALENGGERQNSDREGTSFFGNLGFTPNDMIQLGLIASYGEGDRKSVV